MMSTNVFYEMPDTASLYENQYDLKAGHWPENYNECVLVLTSDGGMSDFLLYTLGLRDALELDEMVRQFLNEETVETPSSIGTYSYDDILGTTFRLVNSADCYEYDSQYQVWKDKSDNEDYMKKLVANGEKLTITGIVQPSPDSAASALTAGINYPASLTRHVVEEAKKSEIVKQQMADSSIDVFTNQEFGTVDQNSGLDMDSFITVDEDKLQNAFQFDDSALSGAFSGDSMNLDFSSAFADAGSSMDLAGAIDLSRISLNFDGLPQLDLGQILSGLTLNVSEDGMQELASSLMEAIRLRLGAPGGGLFPFTGGFRLLHQFHGSTGNPAAPHPDHHCRRRRCFHYTGTDPGTHSADLQRVSGIPDQDGLHRSGTV